MKLQYAVLLILATHLTALPALAQAALPAPDKVRMDRLQLMQGFPPAAPKQVTRGSYLTQYPQARWAFQHMRELLPSRNVPRGSGTPSMLPPGEDLRAAIDALRFRGPEGEQSFAQYLDSTYADGTLMLLDGQLIYEAYAPGMQAQQPHMLWSLSKSVVGLLAGQLLHEGVLKGDAPVTDYLPELAASGWQGATVQQVLDMTAAIDYRETFDGPQSDLFRYALAAGMLPLPPGYQGPTSLYEYLPGIGAQGRHGAEFHYRTAHTEVLGWLLRRATGQSTAELIAERLWSRLGTEQDAYMLVDAHGAEWAGAGFNASLRDLARFGEMLRLDGAYNGRQIIAAEVLANIRAGGDREAFKAGGRTWQPGYSYRNQFWISHNADGAYEALGAHGQMVHINPALGLVVVRLSSHPQASSGFTFDTTRPALEALADWLRRRKSS